MESIFRLRVTDLIMVISAVPYWESAGTVAEANRDRRGMTTLVNDVDVIVPWEAASSGPAYQAMDAGLSDSDPVYRTQCEALAAFAGGIPQSLLSAITTAAAGGCSVIVEDRHAPSPLAARAMHCAIASRVPGVKLIVRSMICDEPSPGDPGQLVISEFPTVT